MGWEYVTEDDLSGSVRDLRIVIVGCGGGGCNSVHRLNSMGLDEAVDTIAINTDRPHLSHIKAHKRLLIGQGITNGTGSGGNPDVGKACGINAEPEITKVLQGADLTFITVGLGGGTGTGLAPIVAEVARRLGSVVIIIATTPFEVELGRPKVALRGLRELRSVSDTILLLDNNRLLDMVSNLPVQQAFMVMDQLISEMVKGIIEVITKPSLINLDFADLRTILGHGGISTVLYAENSDPEALVRDALNNPLLEIDIAGATGALVHITGGDNLTLKRVNKIMERINSYMDDSARVIFGAKVDKEFEGNIRMLAVVTGIAELAEDCDRLDIVEDIGEVVNKYST